MRESPCSQASCSRHRAMTTRDRPESRVPLGLEINILGLLCVCCKKRVDIATLLLLDELSQFEILSMNQLLRTYLKMTGSRRDFFASLCRHFGQKRLKGLFYQEMVESIEVFAGVGWRLCSFGNCDKI